MGLAGFNRARAIHGGAAPPLRADDPPREPRPAPPSMTPEPSPPVLVRDRVNGGHRAVEPRSVDAPPRNERKELFAEAREAGVAATPQMTNAELARRIREACN